MLAMSINMINIDELKNIYNDSRISIDKISEDLLIYLPLKKYDPEIIKLLQEISKDKLIPLLPFLLSWIQDSNWPISKDITPILTTYQKDIIPEIKWILEGNDDIWKYNCISLVLMELPKEFIEPLIPILKKIAYNPTKGEIAEDTSKIAKELLANPY